ncbi:hypothetical protein [Nesterenkonia sp.]|uniref:hypothetical protein n=1 Tax=Nesterenkonia sp. TaxID=704201 RepID=UPI00262A7BCC|nr:hypothetical protein [Nesterenkonia sp.]
MKVRKVTKDHFVLVYKGEVIGGFDGRATTLASSQARRVVPSLTLTRTYLRASGVPVPPTAKFSPHQYEAALRHFRAQEGEVIVSGERKVPGFVARVGIVSEEEFNRAWEREEKAAGSKPKGSQQILLTSTQPGLPVRVLVVGESVAAAVVRIPLHVIGDGDRTVLQLADAEVSRREECSYLAKRQPAIDEDALRAESIEPGQVLPYGQVQRLSSSVQGGSDGRISVDVTDDLAAEIAELAVDAMWAIPGLAAAAVDLIVPSLDSGEAATVIGISAAPDISEFRYPAYGSNRHPHRALMRHLMGTMQD